MQILIGLLLIVFSVYLFLFAMLPGVPTGLQRIVEIRRVGQECSRYRPQYQVSTMGIKMWLDYRISPFEFFDQAKAYCYTHRPSKPVRVLHPVSFEDQVSVRPVCDPLEGPLQRKLEDVNINNGM